MLLLLPVKAGLWIAAQGRGKVQLVGNLFSISATIAMQTGVWLSGEGMGTILSAATAIN
jgi:hypothetical protein